MVDKQAFIELERIKIGSFIRDLNALVNLRAYYDSVDMGNLLTDADFASLEFTKAQLLDAITSISTINSLYLAGHNTNLARIARIDTVIS
jgi:hypothetical protein